LLRLHKAGPTAVHAGLVRYAQDRNYNPGWVGHSFKEIFGQEPRPHHRQGSATPGFLSDLIMEWALTCRRKPPPQLPLFNQGER
jgi:hypothetical protein